MAEIFGRDRILENDFQNVIKGNAPKKKKHFPLNACGEEYSNCCMATGIGDGIGDGIPLPIAGVTVNSSVQNMQTWQYAKTALALIGAYVAIKFLYGKFVK